jgi:carbon dioxide concentrating mechanism protein CcmK
MTLAIGMIEVFGVPTAVEVADAMCKGAYVRLVGFENTDLGRITIVIRGAVAEVHIAVSTGIASIRKVQGGELLSYHIIARPHENLELALPIGRTTEMEDQFLHFPPPLSA